MSSFLVIYNERKCIGSGVCEAMSPELFRVKPSGKAELKGAKLNPATSLWELGVDDKGVGLGKQAADGCPPGCIQVINKETGEKIAPV